LEIFNRNLENYLEITRDKTFSANTAKESNNQKNIENKNNNLNNESKYKT
jgi:hypothetical protein